MIHEGSTIRGILIILFFCIIPVLYTWYLAKTAGRIVLQFTNEGIHHESSVIPWHEIEDARYEIGAGSQEERLELFLGFGKRHTIYDENLDMSLEQLEIIVKARIAARGSNGIV